MLSPVTISTMKINKKILNLFLAFLSLAFWVAVWHVTANKIGKSILLPSPSETAEVFFTLVKTKEFWHTALNSLKSIFSGALAGVAVGVSIALLSYVTPFFKYLFAPLLSLVKATPVASFIILALVWIGKEHIPFAIALMMATPIVSSNVYEGLLGIDRELYEVTKLYNFSFAKSWNMLYRHSLLPYFVSATRSALSLAWKAGIAAEVLCTPQNSIGLMLYESKIYFEFPTLFAWTLTVIILSFILEKAVVFFAEILLGKGRRKA